MNLLFHIYYIKTAYNCCNGGSYKNDFVSTCILKNVIKTGVRCLDFEIYSVGDKPVISSSTDPSYFIKETYNYVLFSDAMNVIVNNAFTLSTCPNADDPLILHMRIKSSNQKMFTEIAKILKQYESQYLLGPTYSYEYNSCHNYQSDGNCYSKNLGDVKLEDLKKKIIIIADKTNTDFIENVEFYEYVNMTSNSMFMRALNYYNVKFTQDMNELQEYNKKNMTISMPDVGTSPENPSGIICRELGCQFISMRYEVFDQNLKENIEFFDRTGYAFVLKPEKLRYVPIIVKETPPNNPLLNYAPRTVSSDYYNFNT